MNGTKIIQLWSRIRQGLIDTIKSFSGEELNYVPFEGSYSVRQIILHIAQEEYGEIQYGITRKIGEFPPQFRPDEYPTIGSAIALLASVHEETCKCLESLNHEELADEIEVQWGETRPLIDFVVHVMEHEIHHRGELSLILGLLGREGLDA
jgi:uncharacterized damage-inducible protein DinB